MSDPSCNSRPERAAYAATATGCPAGTAKATKPKAIERG